jgi:hypothetical protein
MSSLHPQLVEVLDRIHGETGERADVRPPASVLPDLPLALKLLYEACDGFSLHFLDVWSASKVNSSVPGWCCFGADEYFSFCLCSRDGDLDLWDHESGLEPSPAFTHLAQLVESKYDDVLRYPVPAVLDLVAPPPKTPLAPIVSVLKEAAPDSDTKTLLAQFRAGRVTLRIRDRSLGIAAVRSLQSTGFDCKLRLGLLIDE